jgi:C4-dicarboxylate transporter/malic acid transport protein
MGEEINKYLKNFTPIWFAAVLGFGGIALATVLTAKIFDAAWLNPMAIFLVYFNLALLIFLFIIWLARSLIYLSILIKELKHPVMAGFHSLMPAAIVMVSINFSNIGPQFSLWGYQDISIIFWIIGAVFEIILLTVTIYFLIINDEMHINFLNGGWLVPPVAALLTTVAGLSIVPFFGGSALGQGVLWINYFFFGIGVFIFLLIAMSIFGKIFFAERLDPKVFPSLWIIMVPFSLMSLSLSLFVNSTGQYMPGVEDALMGISLLINPMLIGIGIWLLILLIILSYYYLRRIELPYGVGWWAFIFPTASVAIASLKHSAIVNQVFFGYFGLVIYVFLIIIAVIVIYRTIKSFTVKTGNER